LHLLTYIGMPLSTAHASFTAVEKKYPALETLALYQAELALRMNNHTHTVHTLQRAYNLSGNPTIKTQLAYQLAKEWYAHKEWKKALELLERAQNYSEYAPSHNLQAYIYATKANNFERAQEEIEKALKLDPKNSHFLDTKATLLLKQKKFEDALAVWNTINPKDHDFTILCHQGKCQILAGKKQDAIATIKSAQTIAQSKKEKDKAKSLLAQASK
jgi:tetratricopeptide (TPR) repeat protein